MTLSELRALGYALDVDAHARLVRYVELLLEANRKVNLISRASADQVWIAHICDSLALLPLVAEEQPENLLDLGAGGGLPSLPIACVHPELDYVLIDATRKKVAAVEAIVGGVGLPRVRVTWGRAESLVQDPALHERFAVVTARAVGALPELVTAAAGFIRPGGTGWFFKTAQAAGEEIAAARKQARHGAMQHVENRPYRLPVTNAERVIVVYRKAESAHRTSRGS
jgi:16S rRNA (guanine527-N7)-methyltransferase